MNTGKKMFLVFGTLSLILFVLVGVFVYKNVKSVIVEIEENRIKETSLHAVEEITTIINVSINNNLRTTARKSEKIVRYYYNLWKKGKIKKSAAIKKIRKLFLNGPYGKVGTSGYLAVVRKNGLLYIHPKSEGANIAKLPFFKRTLAAINSEKQEGYFEYSWQNKGEKRARTKSGYVVYFKEWDMIVWASAYKTEFSSLINKNDFRKNILDLGKFSNGSAYILGLDGSLVLHSSEEGTNLSKLNFVKEMLNKQNGRIEYLSKNVGEQELNKKLAYYGKVPGMNWIFVMEFSYDKMMSSLTSIRYLIILGSFLAIAIFWIVSLFVGRSIANKIDKFNMIFGIASSGDLRSVYSTDTSERWQDEIDTMGLIFNEFIGGYKGVLLKLRNMSNQVSSLIQLLSSSSQETSSTANQQAASVKEIVSTMEDVDSLSKSVEKKMNEITNIANNTQSVVQDGFGKVEDSIKKMNEINEANKTNIEGIKFLSEKIENIWAIVNMINGIADQTKIIAFNAELEASAAGDAGKNFQIVATEIRRLADSTVHSTNEIRDKITEIQKSSDSLILTSEDGTEKIKEGNRLTQDIKEMFNDILSSAETSSDSTIMTAKSINQQVVTFEQILIAIKQISEGVDNIAVATKETAGASEELGGVSENLESILGRYILTEKNSNK